MWKVWINTQRNTAVSQTECKFMDEHHVKSGISGKLFLSAAIIAAPATAIAQIPGPSQQLQAQLVSGFGAGTQTGSIHRSPKRVGVVRSAAKLIDLSDPAPVKTANPSKMGRSSLPHEAAPNSPFSGGLADLIRNSQRPEPTRQPDVAVNTLEGASAAPQDEIYVERAPTVRRIAIGKYEGDRPLNDSDAVIRVASPVTSAVTRSSNGLQMPNLPSLPGSNTTSPAAPAPAVRRPIRLSVPSTFPQQTDNAMTSMMREALEDEIARQQLSVAVGSGLAEASKVNEQARAESTSRWNQFHPTSPPRISRQKNGTAVPRNPIRIR